MRRTQFAHLAGAIKRNTMLRRIASSLCSRVLGAVVNFTLVIYLGRYLGAAQTGLYMIGFGFATLLSTLARLGLEQIIIREGAPLIRDAHWHALRRLYRRALSISLCASMVIAVVLLVLARLIAIHIFHKAELGNVLPWFALSILPLTFALIHVPFLQIANRPESSIAVLSLWIPLFSLPALLLVHPHSGSAGGKIFLVACVVNALMAFVQWRRFMVHKSILNNHAEALPDPALLAPAMPLLVGNVCQMALLWIAVFAVGIAASPNAVGTYSVAQRVALTLSGFLVPPIDALVGPRLAMMRGDKSREEVQYLVQGTSSVLILSAMGVFVVILLYGSEILKLFGGDFREGYGALVCLSFGQLAIVACGSIRPLLVVYGLEKMIRDTMMAAALCCVVLCAVLIPLIGPLGAAIATSLALAGEKVIEGFIARRRLGISVFPSTRFYAQHVRLWLNRDSAQRRGS
jgi:O-antigen/teichoic acid export membrane protein